MQVRISLVLQFIRLMGLLTAQLNLEGRTRFVQRRLRLEPCVVDIVLKLQNQLTHLSFFKPRIAMRGKCVR